MLKRTREFFKESKILQERKQLLCQRKEKGDYHQRVGILGKAQVIAQTCLLLRFTYKTEELLFRITKTIKGILQKNDLVREAVVEAKAIGKD